MALLAGLGTIGPASAQDMLSPEPVAGWVDEIRFGIHAHDVDYAALPFRVGEWDLSQIEDVSFDVLFTSPDLDVFRWIGSPRPELGATINLDGQESLAHLGLTWQVKLFDSPVYLEGTLGAAAHSGYNLNAPPGFKNFGCTVNFYERFGIGTELGENATATLTYEHSSNNNLCDANDGLSNFGLRVGWKF
ncbi:acyloxyacyl hydrolase [uncultured Devosia sp.]|uniref:acyloxyacyl hydrolase n=1 Tax=uncultured Devosia sp. TaxID=211434 RepID=UPI0035CBF43D